MKQYQVSVIVDGKCVHLYFSHDLDDLVTIRALYRDGHIEIFDFSRFMFLSDAEVAEEVHNSRLRWRDSLVRSRMCGPDPMPPETPPGKKKKTKLWRLTVMCVETGQVFGSVTECSSHIGLPYMTIMNCIKHGNGTRGLHFIAVKEDDNDGQGSD